MTKYYLKYFYKLFGGIKNILLLSGMKYLFISLILIAAVATSYLIFRIRIHRNDVRKAKRIWDDTENFYH